MVKLFKHKNDKSEVTEFYLNIILESLGAEYKIIYDTQEIHDNDIIVTSNMIDAFKISFKNKKVKIINWYQGIIPEEVALKDKAFIRKRLLEYIQKIIPLGKTISTMAASIILALYNLGLITILLGVIEKIALNRCYLNIFVSESMLDFYKKKYKYKKNNYFIMPCFNSKICKDSFFEREKYNNMVFTYIGGLDQWQCFESILKIYKEVEKINANAIIKVFTSNVDQATEKVKLHNINNFIVNHVDNDKLSEEIKGVKYGFLIRQKSPVNYVATPTKMGNYISNGIIPIFSDSINEFNRVFENVEHKIIVNNYNTEVEIARKIVEFDKKEINPESVFNEYKSIFDNYYNRDKYLNKLKNLFLNNMK